MLKAASGLLATVAQWLGLPAHLPAVRGSIPGGCVRWASQHEAGEAPIFNSCDFVWYSSPIENILNCLKQLLGRVMKHWSGNSHVIHDSSSPFSRHPK